MGDIDNNRYIPLAKENGELSTIDAYKCAADFLGGLVINAHSHTDKSIFLTPVAFLYQRYIELRLVELIGNISFHPYGNAPIHHHELDGDCADEYIDELWDEFITFSDGLVYENLPSGGLDAICTIHRYMSLLIHESHSMEIEFSYIQKLSKTSSRIKWCGQSSTIDACKCAGDVLVEHIKKLQSHSDKNVFMPHILFLYHHYMKLSVNNLSDIISFQPHGAAPIFHSPQNHHELNCANIDKMWAQFVKWSEGVWPDNQPPELLDEIGTLIHYFSLLASEPNLNALEISDAQKLMKMSTNYMELIATAFNEISVHTIFDPYTDDLWDLDVNHVDVEFMEEELKKLKVKKSILDDKIDDVESELNQMRFDSDTDLSYGFMEKELRELEDEKYTLELEICDIESEIKSLADV